MSRRALVTGIGGQDGSYLAELLLAKGYEVHGIIRRSSSFNTARIDHIFHDLHLHYGDVTDAAGLHAVLSKVQPHEVYNLAAQSHVRVSFECPGYTQNVVALGTMNLLEAVRAHCPSTRVYQAGSSEMYGLVQETPQRETTPFYPRSPYSAAKVCAHWSCVNYRESYGMHISNGILFNHECLTAETPVLVRRNGGPLDIVEIQEVVPHRSDPASGKTYQLIPKDLEVFDGDKWSRVTLATANWNGGEKEVYRVEARGGLYCATADHKSFREGRVEADTKDLLPGDRLQLFPPPAGPESSIVSPEEAEFLGLMCGDGYVCRSGGSARFTNLDEALLLRASELFTALSCGKSRRDESKRSGFTEKMVPSMEFSGARVFFELWRSELYNERGVKKVPRRILNASREIQLAFLHGYNLADGLKSKTCSAEFKCWVTNSEVLAAGLWMLAESQGLRVAMNYDPRGYVRLNVGAAAPAKGAHLLKPLEEVKTCEKIPHVGWLFDLATESGTFSAGVGRTWVHNSPRRGETFVTRKITRAATRIYLGLQERLVLGNLDSKRDWGFAGDYVQAMWLMLQQTKPDDYVIATGKTYSVRDFLERVFKKLNIDLDRHVGFDPMYVRPAEVDLLLGDSTKAASNLGWHPTTDLDGLIDLMIAGDMKIARAENGDR